MAGRFTKALIQGSYGSGTRAATPDQPAEVPIATSITTQDHCNRPSQPTPAVVKTFPANPLISSGWITAKSG